MKTKKNKNKKKIYSTKSGSLAEFSNMIGNKLNGKSLGLLKQTSKKYNNILNKHNPNLKKRLNADLNFYNARKSILTDKINKLEEKIRIVWKEIQEDINILLKQYGKNSDDLEFISKILKLDKLNLKNNDKLLFMKENNNIEKINKIKKIISKHKLDFLLDINNSIYSDEEYNTSSSFIIKNDLEKYKINKNYYDNILNEIDNLENSCKTYIKNSHIKNNTPRPSIYHKIKNYLLLLDELNELLSQ